MARGSLNAPPPAHVKAHFIEIQQQQQQQHQQSSCLQHNPIDCAHHRRTSSWGSNASAASSSAATTAGSYPHHAFYSFLPTLIPPLKLPPSQQQQQQPHEDAGECTRVQLQKQRLRDHHYHAHAAVRVSKNIPGFQTSAAFFASLRLNLRLNASPPLSPTSTPNSMRASTASLPPPSPLNAPADSVMGDMDLSPASLSPLPPPSPADDNDPLAGVPELRTYAATDADERTAALKLVADSVAQQRQAANSALIAHPLNLAVLLGILAAAIRVMRDRYRADAFFTALTCIGVVMSALAVCRYLTQDYLFAAEALNFAWLGDADVLITTFGDEVIAACVVDWVAGEGTSGGGSGAAAAGSTRQKRRKAGPRGVIRAWTVKLRYRRKSVGAALLEAAVAEARRKGAEALEFAPDHANSKRFLPSLYNRGFDKRDRRSRELLQKLYDASSVRSKKK